MKIIIVGDIHAADNPPASTTPSYMDDIEDMLRWIADYAFDIEADAVVWSGDVFHHKAPSKNSHALVLRMIDIVRYHRTPLWIVTGNHDLSNDRLESLHAKQPLGVLHAAGAQNLVGWHPTLPIFGAPWQQTWTSDPQTVHRALRDFREAGGVHIGMDDWIEPELDISHALVVTHAPIYPPEQVERGVPFDFLPAQDVAAAMGNTGFVYYGHIHDHHGIFSVDGVTFANMGAITRDSLVEYNLTRHIAVAQWDGTSFEEIPVPHKPASEVFQIERATTLKSSAAALSDFTAYLGATRVEIASTGAVVASLRAREDVPTAVRDRAVEFIEAVLR